MQRFIGILLKYVRCNANIEFSVPSTTGKFFDKSYFLLFNTSSCPSRIRNDNGPLATWCKQAEETNAKPHGRLIFFFFFNQGFCDKETLKLEHIMFSWSIVREFDHERSSSSTKSISRGKLDVYCIEIKYDPHFPSTHLIRDRFNLPQGCTYAWITQRRETVNLNY